MKELTYVNKKYLGIIESQVAPNPQYLWLKDGDLKRFDNGEWVALNSLEADEYYADMAVGTADNLRGRDEAIEREFTFDVSAGEKNSIKEEGTATITKIKGNTMCWNQLIYNGDFKINGGDNTLPDGWTIIGHEDWENYLHISYDEDGINIEVIAPLTSQISFGHVLKGGQAPQSGLNAFLCNYTLEDTPNRYIVLSHNNSIYSLTPGSHQTISLQHNNFYSFEFRINSSAPVGTKIKIHYARLNNLFLLYPTLRSGEAIEAINKDFPNDYYDYCEGTFFNNKTEKIVTTGFNQWDEEWVVGEYTIIDGKLVFDSKAKNRISSKNLIEVFPETTYYFHAPNNMVTQILYLDSHENYIDRINISRSEQFITSENTKYIRFTTNPTGNIIYKNDICINISHSGVADGTYHPYVEFEHEVPVNKYFPNGMRSAISAYDEINEKEAIQRICSFKVSDCFDNMVINPGDLEIRFAAPYALVRYRSSVQPNIICNKLSTCSEAIYRTIPSSIASDSDTGKIIIRDIECNTLKEFKEKYGDVTIYAELAEPIVTPLKARAINFNYPVWDWGTERAVSAEPNAIVNVPFKADIIYGFNAVDTIRGNKKSIEDLDSDLTSLEDTYNLQASRLFLGIKPEQSLYRLLQRLPLGAKFWSGDLEGGGDLAGMNAAEYRIFYKGTNDDPYIGVERELHAYSNSPDFEAKVLRRLWINSDGYVERFNYYMMPSDKIMDRDIDSNDKNITLYPGTTYVNNTGNHNQVILNIMSVSPYYLENTNFKAIIPYNVPSQLTISINRGTTSGSYNVSTYGLQYVTVEVIIPELDMKVLQCKNRPTFVHPTHEEFKKYVKVTGWDAEGNLVKLM